MTYNVFSGTLNPTHSLPRLPSVDRDLVANLLQQAIGRRIPNTESFDCNRLELLLFFIIRPIIIMSCRKDEGICLFHTCRPAGSTLQLVSPKLLWQAYV